MFDNCLIASNCLSPNFVNGAVGAGFTSACARAVAAGIAASADESVGIIEWCGKNSTVRMIRVVLGLGMKTL